MSETARPVIVAAMFNQAVMRDMVEAATEKATELGYLAPRVIEVAGAYELPLVISRVLFSGHATLVVALGFIERGETLHGEVMGHVVHDALIRLQLETGTPIGLGIIGPGATPEQAASRARDFGAAAMAAAATSEKTLAQVTAV